MLKTKKQSLVVVLGMHRSGTSLITRGLQVLGVELGDNLLQPSGDNEKGYWEDTDIQALNVEILKALDSDWDRLALISHQEINALRKLGLEGRAIALLSKKAHDNPVFGFKDPRITKLLPFWNAIFASCDFEVRYVFAIRNPMSTIQSLLKRDNLDKTHGYLLWLSYMVAGLNGTGDIDPVLVDYDRLINSPSVELQRLAAKLKLELDSDRLEIYLSRFLDAGLRHFDFSMSNMLSDQYCPSIVGDVYEHLLAVASVEQRIDQKKLSAWTAEVEKLAPVFSYIDRLNHKVNHMPKPYSFRKSLYYIGSSLFRKLPFKDRLKRLLLS